MDGTVYYWSTLWILMDKGRTLARNTGYYGHCVCFVYPACPFQSSIFNVFFDSGQREWVRQR